MFRLCKVCYPSERIRFSHSVLAFGLSQPLDPVRPSELTAVRATGSARGRKGSAVMGNELSGKIAVVTGGASGLGAGIVERFPISVVTFSEGENVTAGQTGFGSGAGSPTAAR